VNPARLSAALQMDICMQCHLETTSSDLPQMIRQLERDANSYRAGEPLGSYMVHFDHAPGSGHDDKFEVVNQAYRLRQSACFLKSGGRLTCTSCHDPHTPQRGDAAASHYRTKCLACHPSVVVRGHPDLSSADCRSCHMVRRPADDFFVIPQTDARQMPIEDPTVDCKSEPFAWPRMSIYPHNLIRRTR
jgi:predicted CXXCH cytochrome family protein